MNDHSLDVNPRVSCLPLRAALITEYQHPLSVEDVVDPVPPEGGVVLRVEATGICRSDWHTWMGHEDIPGLPHVPGHEMAGVVVEAGSEVTRWEPGDRVTVPFSIGCGECRSCREGHLNTCDRPFTPGFSAWGSFAELVAIDHANINLVLLPAGLDPVRAAALGCRFITAFAAVVDRGRLRPGESLVVYGCGGVGLSAVMIGTAIGARVVAVDVDSDSLEMAGTLGADHLVDASEHDPVEAVRELTGGGAHLALEAVGRSESVVNSILSLRKHGRQVQVGLTFAEHAAPSIPMMPVIMGELEILGIRGMPAICYPRVFELIESGDVDPGLLVTETVGLDEASGVIEGMGWSGGVGTTVIDRF
jgi:alcohol dehydrogenase